MHGIQSLRDVRALDQLFGIPPGAPRCDTYPADAPPLPAYRGRRTPDEGEIIAVARFNPETLDITIVPYKPCSKVQG